MKEIIINILIVVTTILVMEVVSWASHKYIMHGFMWRWHKSHHTYRKGRFEKNDLFALLFSLPSMSTIILGTLYPKFNFLLYIGFGMLGYGILYFIFHDVIVHRRVKFKLRVTNNYLQRIIRAHHEHHKVHTREGAEAFGFLYASNKFEDKDKV